MSEPSFVYVTYIRTTPEKVWEALTSPAFTEKFWYGRRIESDWKLGSSVASTFKSEPDFSGEVLESEPPRRLVFTFRVADSRAAEHAEGYSRVAYDIERQGPVVRLCVTHDRFPDNSVVLRGVSRGWPAILSSLKSFLETGTPLPSDIDRKRLEEVGGKLG